RVEYHEGVVRLADGIEIRAILAIDQVGDRTEASRLRERAGAAERPVGIARVGFKPARSSEDGLCAGCVDRQGAGDVGARRESLQWREGTGRGVAREDGHVAGARLGDV